MRLLLIVPALNEANNLPRVADAIRRAGIEADVCVVDDGSADATAEVAAGLGLRVLKLPFNLGIGGAVQAGYIHARDRGYDVAVQLDGDGQHDVGCLDALLEPVRAGRADLVVGSRFLGDSEFRSTLVRRAGIRYLSWFLRLRCGARVTDATSGFRAVSRRAIELFARRYPSDYPEPESIALARREGLTIAEVPVRMTDRVHGASSINWRRTLYYLVKVSLALLILPIPEEQGAGQSETA